MQSALANVPLKLFLSLSLNVASSVGVIFINKRLVFMEAEFKFGTLLTIIHFIVTFLGCLLFARLNFFEVKRLSISSVLSISLAFCGYVVFNNLSLLTNAVSIYQIAKILATPVIVFIEMSWYKKHESRETLISLVPVCLGVFITVYAAADLSPVGIFWSFLALLANTFYTIWGKTKQQELSVTPLQILTYQAPLSAFILLTALPLDGLNEIWKFRHTPYSISVIFLSCVFAFGVNFSFFLFVGQTSALTMNVVGYLKTVLVFLISIAFFESNVTLQSLFGITMTCVGLALYSRSKLMPQKETFKSMS
jgi:solute carrier family 35 protein E3